MPHIYYVKCLMRLVCTHCAHYRCGSYLFPTDFIRFFVCYFAISFWNDINWCWRCTCYYLVSFWLFCLSFVTGYIRAVFQLKQFQLTKNIKFTLMEKKECTTDEIISSEANWTFCNRKAQLIVTLFKSITNCQQRLPF